MTVMPLRTEPVFLAPNDYHWAYYENILADTTYDQYDWSGYPHIPEEDILKVRVHPRIWERHGRENNITFQAVEEAWWNVLARKTDYFRNSATITYIGIGVDDAGRDIEFIAERIEDGSILIYHADFPENSPYGIDKELIVTDNIEQEEEFVRKLQTQRRSY